MLISGRQSTNEVTPVLVDSLGRVIVSGSDPSAINPTGVLSIFSVSLPAGTSTQTAYTVSAGQRLRLTHFHILYVGTVAGVILVPYVDRAGNSVVINYYNAVVSGVYVPEKLDILLEAGDTAKCSVVGATLNDTLQIGLAFQRYK